MKVKDVIKVMDNGVEVELCKDYTSYECTLHPYEEWSCNDCKDYMQFDESGDCLHMIEAINELSEYTGRSEDVPIKYADCTVKGISVREHRSHRKTKYSIAIKIGG